MPLPIAANAARQGIRPERTRSVAPATAQIASGHRNGRRITPAVARAEIVQIARMERVIGFQGGLKKGPRETGPTQRYGKDPALPRPWPDLGKAR